MPELPEVEVVRQSLDKKIKQKKVKKVIVRNRNLRFRVPVGFENFLKNKRVLKVGRFSKFGGILNLKFLFLTKTFLIILDLIFLFNDCLTISTSGNSGISHYIIN